MKLYETGTAVRTFSNKDHETRGSSAAQFCLVTSLLASPLLVIARDRFKRHRHVVSGFEDEGVVIAVSSVQLAAILTGESIGEEATFTNRVSGTIRTLGGVLELVGASALCLAPDPTLTTKAGCVFMGGHGSDLIAAGLIEMFSGRAAGTLTEASAKRAAGALGASENTANKIALTVEVGVPALFTVAIGAARVAAIRGGRISLRQHEVIQGAGKGGGHTIARHVGKTEAQLRERLVSYKQALKTPPEALSSFKDLATAERAITRVLRINGSRIKVWAKGPARSPRLELDGDAGEFAGHGIMSATGKLEKMRNVRVVLIYKTFNGMPYYILTAFPKP
jgi:hypothetical protein